MTRKHELDWLRVLLFALLVPHHIAVGFVDWGVDIYRFVNNSLAGDGMTLFIYWSHSWRLPSLFLIAGIGTWFLTSRGAGPRFMGQRLLRLGIPLLFGTLFINVFGGYAIALMTGDISGFLPFFWRWITAPEPGQVQHLWFLVNLSIYTMMCWPMFAFRERITQWMPQPAVLIAFLLLLSAVAVVSLKPFAPALAGDDYQFALYFLFFSGGYLIGADHERLLDWTRRNVWWLLAGAAVFFAAKVVLLTIVLLDDVATGQALAEGGWVPEGLTPPNATIFSIIEALTAWFWCLAALGLAARYLTKGTPLLDEFNRAVFPFYVLHFPLTLIGLAIAAQAPAPWWLEFFLLLIFVYGLTWGLWRLIDRLGQASYLIGGKPKPHVH
ncbi:acyltransferase family protein [Boseongicola aestuarii]|uniref:Glucans biosynthesis protein C n=1 Tax=Boseongicola aestuarii TaxID=1470561 RepID=A0A238J620_9RHOB|nr:acyltransferase family protein [Boseongicola aestuarii]SMX25813.1 Glucans biosynthesis protein C [Boseongicola aestuarii]